MKQAAIPAFAFVVTLCIATYNKRNDQHYDELIGRAAELERELQIEHGSFENRPRTWLKYGVVPVEHRWPIGLIYAAAASLWAYLFTASLFVMSVLEGYADHECSLYLGCARARRLLQREFVLSNGSGGRQNVATSL